MSAEEKTLNSLEFAFTKKKRQGYPAVGVGLFSN